MVLSQNAMSETSRFLSVVAVFATVGCVSSLTCYDCVSGSTSRAGSSVPCDGMEEHWRTCTVDDGGSCLLLEQGVRRTRFTQCLLLLAVAYPKPVIDDMSP